MKSTEKGVKEKAGFSSGDAGTAEADVATASKYCRKPCPTKGCIGVCILEQGHVQGRCQCANGHRWRG